MKNAKLLKWLMVKTKRRIPALILLTVLSAAFAYLGVQFTLATRTVIDSATGANNTPFMQAVIVLVILIVLRIVSRVVCIHLNDKTLAKLDIDWKKQLTHTILHGQYYTVSRYHSGELINRLTNDVNIVDNGLVSILPSLATVVTRLVAAVIVMASLDAKFTLLVVCGGLALVGGTALIRKLLKGMHKKVREADGKLSSFLQEVIERLMIVQAMDVGDEVERRSEVLLEERYALIRKRKNLSMCASTAVNIVCYVAEFVALVWCAYRLLKGEITFGTLIAITQLVGQLEAPFVNFSSFLPQYIAMVASAERLKEIDDIESEVVTSIDGEKAYSELKSISARDLCFSYDDGIELVLDNLSFDIPKNTFTAITGHSGIGKSTLLKLMLGIYPKDSGELYAQTNEKTELSRATRSLFAYVPQNNFLFSGTLKENLLLIKPDATDEEIQNALHISCMDEVVNNLPDGLDTVLGENSAGLSEGQAQRISIARAILCGAPILLLDEATSSLDAKTEEKVLERIKALPERTCIAVTHRPAAADIADIRLEFAK